MCASTRGVVLDVVDSMTSNTLIHNLRKFISRRGAPALIISDNGSSFTAQETQRFVANREIKWMFNLERAPWRSGIWERFVLKKTIGCKRLSFMELVTIVQDIVFVLNNRPLCDPCDEDTVVLTPNHLLFGRKLEVMNYSKQGESIPNEDGKSLNKRQKHLVMMMNHFWRWQIEYLMMIRDTYEKGSSKIAEIINVGDIVIVNDEKIPRHLWKLG